MFNTINQSSTILDSLTKTFLRHQSASKTVVCNFGNHNHLFAVSLWSADNWVLCK